MKNFRGAKKLIVVGFSFFVIGMSVFFIQELEMNNEVNAMSENSHLTDNGDGTYTVDHAPTPGSLLQEFDGTNDVESVFYLGVINGNPVPWRLVWDYGDGTGLAYSNVLGYQGANAGTVERFFFSTDCETKKNCLKNAPVTFYQSSYYNLLYGANDMDGSTMVSGGIGTSYINQWRQASSLNATTNDKAGQAVLKKNNNLQNPFLLSGERLSEQTGNGWHIDTGHVGVSDFTDLGLNMALSIPTDLSSKYFIGSGGAWVGSPDINTFSEQLWSVIVTKTGTLKGDFPTSNRNNVRLALPIVLPLKTISSVTYSPIITSFKEGKSSALKNTDIGNISTDGLGPYTVNIESSGTTNASDVDEKGTLVGAGLPLSDKFVLNDTNTTKGTATLSIGNSSLLEGTYYVKVTIKDIFDENEVAGAEKVYSGGADDPERTKSVVLKIVVDPADVKAIFTTKESFTYGDSELSTNGTIGSLSAIANGTSIKANYQFIHSNSTLSNNSEDGLLTIDNAVEPAIVKVKSTSSLGADAGSQKAYNYDIRATNTNNNTFGDVTASFSVDPMDLTIQTLFGSTAYPSTSPKEITIHDTTYKGTESFSTNPVTLPYGESLGIGSYSYMNGTSTTTPETVVGTYEMNVTFPSSSVDLINNYKVVYENSFLKVKPDSFTSLSFHEVGKTTPFKPLTYGDTGTLSGEAIGDFALVTTGGTTSGTYQFVDTLGDTGGTTASSTKDELEIVNNQIKVKTGEKLKAKTYDCFVRVTTTSGISHVEPIKIEIKKREVQTQTKIKNLDSLTIDVNEALPLLTDFSFVDEGGFLTSDNISATYQFKNQSDAVISEPNKQAGTYNLVATYSDESNYQITKSEATLVVQANEITDITSTLKSKYIYGDGETTNVAANKLGSLAITTKTGNDEVNATYELCSDAAGSGASSSYGSFSIRGSDLVVKNAKLEAGSYDIYVKATSDIQDMVKIKKFTIKVDPKPVSIKTKFNLSDDALTIDVNDALPPSSDYKFEVQGSIGSGFLDGENTTPTYRYKDEDGSVNATPNLTQGMYTLEALFGDEKNYKITQENSILTVEGNGISDLNYDGVNTYTYGDSAIISGGNTLGNLSIKTNSGNDEANPTFMLCDDAQGTNPSANKGSFAIVGSTVQTTAKLDVGTYNLFVQATSKIQGMKSSVKTITIDVTQKDIHVSITNPSSIVKKVGESLSSKNITIADLTLSGLLVDQGDTLVGTPTLVYEGNHTDLSVGNVGVKVTDLADNNPKNNYNIIYDVATLHVTQDTLLPTDYKITGTLGANGWYTSDVKITILKPGFDEFITSPPASSLGNVIAKDTNGEHKDMYLQLRNTTTQEITTSLLETIKIDKQEPDFTILATVDGAAYEEDTPTTNSIQVEMKQAVPNASKLTYYYTTDANDALTNPIGDPDKWTSLGNGISTIDFQEPQRTTYYFKAVSGAGKFTNTASSIKIYNNALLPNPVDLGWVDNTNYDLKYGDSKTLEIKGNAKNYPIRYRFYDGTNEIDVSSCLSMDTSGNIDNIKAVTGVCPSSSITLKAQVGSYATPLIKTITVQKAQLEIGALYQNSSNVFVSSIDILTKDPEPLKKLEITNKYPLVGDEIDKQLDALGSFQYSYLKQGEATSTESILTENPGKYTITPSFDEPASNILDKYDISWKSAVLNINDSNLEDAQLYEVKGNKGRNDWYTSVPVTIHPKHPDFNKMSVDGSNPSTSDYAFGFEGEHNAISLVFEDGLGHTISKTLQLKIDTTKPIFEVEAMSDGKAYISGSESKSDVSIMAMKASTSNPSNVQYYYTTNQSISANSPIKVDGTPSNGWTEITGRFDLSTTTTLYIKGVSGAGLESDLVSFIANIHKVDYNKVPSVSVSSGSKAYPADGSWTNKDVIFTLGESTSGYEVCSSSSMEEPCTSWSDISDPTNSTHNIIGTIQNQYYWFRIKDEHHAFASTKEYKVSLDKQAPDQPIILVTKKNTGNVARFLNTVSFGQWFKEALEVSMTSSDAHSGIKAITYDIYDKDGAVIARDQPYESTLEYLDVAYVLEAKAIDHAGNVSAISAQASVFIDTLKPSIQGVKDQEVYDLPFAFLHYEDQSSGIDPDNTTQSNGSTTSPLENDTLFSGKGNVNISVSDYAGNRSEVEFRINGLPDISSWNCNENYDAIIENVKKQYSALKSSMATHNKVLSAAQTQEIEEWLVEANGTCQLSEPDNNVTIESEGDRIPPNTVLVVDVLTTTIPPESIQVKKGEEIKAAYDVYMKRDGEIFKSINDATLTVRLPMGAFKGEKGLRLIELNDDESVKEIKFVEEDNKAVFKTTVLKKYAFIGEKSKINIDTDGDGKPDINIDINGDKEAELNVDLNEDGIPDVNIDSNGDGEADYNIDTDGDGVPDVNIGPINKPWEPDHCVVVNKLSYCTVSKKEPYLNIDTDKDLRPDLNVDLNKDKEADINIDTDFDNIPNVDIDRDGDGKIDLNKDIDGDGEPDINLVKLTIWTPNKNIDKPIKFDTMEELTPLENVDTNGDDIPDENINQDWLDKHPVEDPDEKPGPDKDPEPDVEPDVNPDEEEPDAPDVVDKETPGVPGNSKPQSSNTGGASTGEADASIIYLACIGSMLTLLVLLYTRKRES